METAGLTEATRAVARAEAAQYRTLLDVARAEQAVIDASDETPLGRQVWSHELVRSIARAMRWSEGQVTSRLAVAERAHDDLPAVWVAFTAGRVDAARLREIAQAAGRLERPESVEVLDQKASAYAETHTVAELRRWLKRLTLRLEPAEAADRADAERADRRVSVEHGPEGMSWLTAYVPSDQAAAIAFRLTKAARSMDEADPRTHEQRRADLFVAWALGGESADALAVRVDIALTIPADVLAGASEGWAVADDGSWAIPAAWVAEIATTMDPFWHRMVLDPVTDDILAHDYVGRFAPEILRKAIAFRDEVCSSPGCLKPAASCDIDHRIPWPHGPTRGDNLQALCRRHHRLKGHGFTPPPQTGGRDPFGLEVSWMERWTAEFIRDAA